MDSSVHDPISSEQPTVMPEKSDQLNGKYFNPLRRTTFPKNQQYPDSILKITSDLNPTGHSAENQLNCIVKEEPLETRPASPKAPRRIRSGAMLPRPNECNGTLNEQLHIIPSNEPGSNSSSARAPSPKRGRKLGSQKHLERAAREPKNQSRITTRSKTRYLAAQENLSNRIKIEPPTAAMENFEAKTHSLLTKNENATTQNTLGAKSRNRLPNNELPTITKAKNGRLAKSKAKEVDHTKQIIIPPNHATIISSERGREKNAKRKNQKQVYNPRRTSAHPKIQDSPETTSFMKPADKLVHTSNTSHNQSNVVRNVVQTHTSGVPSNTRRGPRVGAQPPGELDGETMSNDQLHIVPKHPISSTHVPTSKPKRGRKSNVQKLLEQQQAIEERERAALNFSGEKEPHRMLTRSKSKSMSNLPVAGSCDIKNEQMSYNENGRDGSIKESKPSLLNDSLVCTDGNLSQHPYDNNARNRNMKPPQRIFNPRANLRNLSKGPPLRTENQKSCTPVVMHSPPKHQKVQASEGVDIDAGLQINRNQMYELRERHPSMPTLVEAVMECEKDIEVLPPAVDASLSEFNSSETLRFFVAPGRTDNIVIPTEKPNISTTTTSAKDLVRKESPMHVKEYQTGPKKSEIVVKDEDGQIQASGTARRKSNRKERILTASPNKTDVVHRRNQDDKDFHHQNISTSNPSDVEMFKENRLSGSYKIPKISQQTPGPILPRSTHSEPACDIQGPDLTVDDADTSSDWPSDRSNHFQTIKTSHREKVIEVPIGCTDQKVLEQRQQENLRLDEDLSTKFSTSMITNNSAISLVVRKSIHERFEQDTKILADVTANLPVNHEDEEQEMKLLELPTSFGAKKHKPKAKRKSRDLINCSSKEDHEPYVASCCSSDRRRSRRRVINYSDIPDFPYIDSHCHLDYMRIRLSKGKPWFETWEDIKECYTDTPSMFSGCIWNLVNPEFLRKQHDWIYRMIQDPIVLATTVGCHPHFVNEWDKFQYHYFEPPCNIHAKSMSEWMKYMLSNRECYKVMAVGECGLDVSKTDSNLDMQLHVFREQLYLAKHYSLPVVIHCRGNIDTERICLGAIIDIMGPYASVHRHCFREGPEVAQLWLNGLQNCYFGFTPAIANGLPKEIESLKLIPLSRILLETDAPFFGSETYTKKRRNDRIVPFGYPAEANVAAYAISEIKNSTPAFVLGVTKMNTERLYNLDTCPRFHQQVDADNWQ